MGPALRRNTFALCLLGFAFLLHFQLAKHWRPWAAVCPFVDDPWDAVGSFAVQFVLFMMIVCLVRAFRPSANEASSVESFARCALMTSTAIAFTSLSDIAAMARHIPLWRGRSQGLQLLAVTALLLLWSVAAAAWFVLSARAAQSPRHADRGKLAIPAAALAVLAFYPENLRSSVVGAILTALCGSLLLFVTVWAIGTAFPLELGRSSIRTAGGRIPFFARLRRGCIGWIVAIGIGFVCGAFLVAQELEQPGPSPHGSRRLLVIAVYLFLESAGVVLGYALLAEPLGLVSRE